MDGRAHHPVPGGGAPLDVALESMTNWPKIPNWNWVEPS